MSARKRGSRGRSCRVGIFGKLGAGNFGNDASMDAILEYLRDSHPEVALDAMTTGPRVLREKYGMPAIHMFWNNNFQPQSAMASGVIKVLGRALDTVRTAAWVRRHDVVIVPGAGILETTLPMVPRGWPYALFLLSVYGRIFRTKVALVSVGASPVKQPMTRWLFDHAVKHAFYRSYRDAKSRETLRGRGLDVSSDEVTPDLAFALSVPAAEAVDERLVAVGVMDFHGSNDERAQADEIFADYIAKMQQFVNWLVGGGRRVLLVVGDTNGDGRAVAEIFAALRTEFPDLDASTVRAAAVSEFAQVMHALLPVNSVVAIRYHNVLCALMLSKPTIAISYYAKHEQLMESMGLGEYPVAVRGLDVDELKKRFIDLEEHAAELRKTLLERNAANRAHLDSQFKRLSALLFGVS